MSISGTVYRHEAFFNIGHGSMGRIKPGTNFRRSHPLLRAAKLAVECRPHPAVPGERRPLRLLRGDAVNGKNFSETGEFSLRAVIFGQQYRAL